MSETVRILGIDPGLRRTGWGIITATGTKLSYGDCGVVTSDGDLPLALRLRELYEGIGRVVAATKPDEVSVEETFVNKDAQATLKLGHARAVALLVPALAGIPVSEYSANLIKKTVAGSGHAEKVQIQAMVRFLLPKAEFKLADAADALAIAITHASHRGAHALAKAHAPAALSGPAAARIAAALARG
ncbi:MULTISPECIES: crossover junction endodeoxyribonuclease RuvC [Methylobacterium]|uniref:Crossover junction endodeoxyribonuclease RuvC n=3 Tax=Pseudomonadota TaxID=1224 RepID=A0ABQ4SS33_9HYPH|nr:MULTISPECIES: crossover junction endodeoxyribonuclease RuvC [Methylobacterium]PIU04833.1 MAG: crossover junction endodeoxyribonuclease RuvC [Methylobacterium sp. CG09_land_8_20_14_0_10_71_15]PIU16045.1 MAG: crossover junction endodeoxyribonuclease RuvC [Methylobacterium sp. CG08_land_8_20_14_0_20_71_15]GBU18665.1 component of RuvABC resolvasome [Methylobacterium sp.]GJE06002.1 Crossover junction endodeoxyribonuclease RuvC [Methylobacterium jeotgali]